MFSIRKIMKAIHADPMTLVPNNGVKNIHYMIFGGKSISQIAYTVLTAICLDNEKTKTDNLAGFFQTVFYLELSDLLNDLFLVLQFLLVAFLLFYVSRSQNRNRESVKDDEINSSLPSAYTDIMRNTDGRPNEP